MIHMVHLRNDLRQIIRDPIMLILMVVPLLIIGIFKMLLIFAPPFLLTRYGIDVSPYYIYIIVFTLLMMPGMLGIVTGFMMLDDKDGNIAELMSVTPLGRSGYLINRLSLSAFLSIGYSLMAYCVLDVIRVPFFSLLLLTFLLAMYSAIIGLLLFGGADDKVKGLTFAKALNILALFAFTDLLSLRWLTVVSWFFPSYWVTAIIKNPDSLPSLFAAIFCFTFWLGALVIRYWRKGI